MSLSFPFIDDVAPAKHKTLWFGILGLTQPVGIALGYIAIGQVATASSWRASFFVEVSDRLMTNLSVFLSLYPIPLMTNISPLLYGFCQ